MIRLLKPGGRLLLSVPNASVMRIIDPHNRFLLNQPPHHMGHWDEDVFRSLEDLLPLNLISVHREPLASYHVEWMIISYLKSKFYFFKKAFLKFIVNRYTTLPFQLIMKAGFRNFFPGHTILVEFQVKLN